MNYKKISIITLGLFFFAFTGKGQELNCTVDIVSPQIQDATAQALFANLKAAITQYMNTTKFTNDDFTPQEKIECSIFINMTGQNSSNDFNATMQIQSRRPVYKSSYSSPILNFQDNNIDIVYQLNQPIILNINVYTDNLTSLLDFYAYIIIASDYDTFSLDGGTPYYLKAQTVLNNAQPSGYKGWNPQDGDQTRYVYLNNLLDETYFAPMRKAMYEYHRLGLDVMYQNPDQGRQQIIDALKLVQGVDNERPLNYNEQLFFNAKATEIDNLFADAPSEEKANVLAILSAIDPTDSPKYANLKATEE